MDNVEKRRMLTDRPTLSPLCLHAVPKPPAQSRQNRFRIPEIVRLVGLVVGLFSLILMPSPIRADAASLAQAQIYLDQGKVQEALSLIDRTLATGQPSAEALLLRSTANIMRGYANQGFKDLKRALKIDPALRQGWLNLAGLEIVEKRYDEATSALLEARKLDPAAPDSYLNLGAVAMLQGRSKAATKEFRAYLERAENLGEAHYLVAANYALGDQAQLAVEHLATAIQQDERFRLRARSDDRYAALVNPRYTELLNNDSYQPPPDAHSVAAAFDTPYSRESPRLLYAVLDAMKELGERYDPKVEATKDWALIWAEMRIKVWNQGNGSGVVSLSAPVERFTTDQWHQRSQALFQAIYRILSTPELKPLVRRPG